jgi:acetoin utilization deacetylase AcuC-like enzyme
LAIALQLIEAFAADAPLVLSLGFDTHVDDPIGGFTLRTAEYAQLGAMIGGLGQPTIVLQEGGYAVAALGASAAGLLDGLRQALSRR